MRLDTVVDQIEMEFDLAKCTIDQYRRSAKRFSEYLGRLADAADLTRENLNAFIADCQKQMTNTTAGNYRRALCRVWNYLTETEDIAAYEIKRLRRPKAEERPVVAWDVNDLPKLIAAARELPGKLKIGIPAAHYFEAWIWFEFDTGLRPSDMQRIAWGQLDRSGKQLLLTQNKTRKPHCVFLGEETIAALDKIRTPARDLIFPLTWGGLRKWADKLYILATHHGFHRNRGQNLGTLRKTHATTIYIEHGEAAAAESLGHVSGTRIARKYYIDHRARRRYSIPSRPNATPTRKAE